MDNEGLDELVKDIEKRGVRGMRWGHRKTEAWARRQSTQNLLSHWGSAQSRVVQQSIETVLRGRPGGMAALGAAQRRAEEEHKRRWGKK